MQLDFAYVHVFVRDGEVRRTDRVFADTPVEATVQTRARTQASGDVVGLALRYQF